MSSSLGWRSPLARSLNLALATVAGAVLVMGAMEIGMVYSTGTVRSPWTAVLFVLVAWVYVSAGVLAWARRPSNRLGALIVAGGLALLVAGLASSGVPVLVAGSSMFATLSLAVVVHLLHAFPTGRVELGIARATVVAGYLVCLPLQAPLYLFTRSPRADGLLMVADRPDLAQLGGVIQAAAGATVMVVTTGVLVHRLRRADPQHRRILAPLFAYGIFAVLFIPLSASVLAPWLGMSPELLNTLQLLDLAGIPLAFVFGMLRGGFARTGELEELGAWLGAADGGRPALAESLRRALGDDSLDLVFWLDERGEYVDASGRLSEPPGTGSRRGAVEIDLAGRRIGAIYYDARLIADPGSVRAAGQVVALAVDRERLTARLLASGEALRGSRARVVEAADRERRRIARDLHDGLQVRLVLLAVCAEQVAKDQAAPPSVGVAARELRVGLDEAAAELRHVVRAVMPAALIEVGLVAATEDLVDRMPLPTRLELTATEGTLPMVVASTAYFVVAEGLANALKHAHAAHLTVSLNQTLTHLVVEVGDDGVGGVCTESGSGLRGLADRVDTLAGSLRVHSPAGVGTRLVAELPCGS